MKLNSAEWNGVEVTGIEFNGVVGNCFELNKEWSGFKWRIERGS